MASAGIYPAKQASGVGGWLLVFCILNIIPLAWYIIALTWYFVVYRTPITSLRQSLGPSFENWLYLAFAIYAAFVSFQLWKIRPHSLTYLRIFFLAQLTFGALAILSVLIIREPAGWGNGTDFLTGTSAMIYAWLWGSYFQKSRRVWATYGRNLAKGNHHGSHTLPDVSPPVSAPAQPIEQPVRVRGWLGLFCFLYTVVPALYVFAYLLYITELLPMDLLMRLPDPGKPSLETLCSIGFAICMTFVGVQVWIVDLRALVYVKILLIAQALLGGLPLLKLLIIDGIIRRTPGENSIGETIGVFAGLIGFVWATSWYAYFQKSKRVRATYGRAL